jgi:hypothetical protein
LKQFLRAYARARDQASFIRNAYPDLIGVRERRFLDSTGLFRQRDIADLMRYAALNQGADELSEYGGFRPKRELPDPATQGRYSDEQLYALALFIYSLHPPVNPNRFDALAARGQNVFAQEVALVIHCALYEQPAESVRIQRCGMISDGSMISCRCP